MSVTYHYKNLGELAAYFESKAVELRERATDTRSRGSTTTLRIRASLVGEASGYESAAYILRNTVIEP